MKVKTMDVSRVAWPKIAVDERAFEWIRAIVELHDTEVGFFACVDKNADNVYFIRNVEYPKQYLVNGGTCEMDREGQALLMVKLINEGREADIGKMKVWGHSHVNMSVGPSKQDDDQALQFAKEHAEGDFMIRLIANKKGDMNFALFDFKSNMIFEDVEYSVSCTDSAAITQNKVERIARVISENPRNNMLILASTRAILDENAFYQEACDYINLKKPEFIPTTIHQGSLFEKNNYPLQQGRTHHFGKISSFGNNKGEEEEEHLMFQSGFNDDPRRWMY